MIHLVFLLGLGLLPLLVSATGSFPDEEWHDATTLEIEGKGWTETEAFYDRLPAHARGHVPSDVWDLSKDSTGLCVRFQTDSRHITVHWVLTSDRLAMPHMPATGVSGVDLYRKSADGHWHFVQNGRPGETTDNRASFQSDTTPEGRQEYLLYLPLYNGVRNLEIGITPGAHIEKPPPRPAQKRLPVVVYGTSIVQGGCASRPGMAHVAIVGRKLDRPIINLGFSGSGKMEPEVAAVLAELDPALFVIDCLANMSALPQDEIARRITTLVHTLRRAHPDTPILFVGQSSFRVEKHPTPASRIQEQAVKTLIAEGVQHLSLMGGEHLLGTDGEGTVDGSHPNDLGMMRQADALFPVLKGILEKHPRPLPDTKSP